MQHERTRQITQDLEQFPMIERMELLCNDTVTQLETEEYTVDAQIPSRVEGRHRIEQQVKQRLARVASYGSVGDLIDAHHKSRASKQESVWTLDDIPAEVKQECDTWVDECDERVGGSNGALGEAARAMATQPIDRMIATQACPDCRYGETQYACRTSGWSKNLYRYPLIKVHDTVSDEVYEVPFDAALYIEEHPTVRMVQANKEVSYDGLLSAKYTFGLSDASIASSYVVRATNGNVTPRSDFVTMTTGNHQLNDICVLVDEWSEATGSAVMAAGKELLGPEACIEKLQDKVMQQLCERVTDVDNNRILDDIKVKLGKNGLRLFFHWQQEGSDEYVAKYEVTNNVHKIVAQSRGMDAYEGLALLAQDMDITIPKQALKQ